MAHPIIRATLLPHSAPAHIRASLLPSNNPTDIKIGTVAGQTFREVDTLDTNDPVKVAAENAFLSLKGILGAERLFVDVDNARVFMTCPGGPEERLLLGEVKQRIMNTRSCSWNDAEEELGAYIQAIEQACKRSKLSKLSHYSPYGADVLASQIGEKPLQITRDSHPIIKNKQATSLAAELTSAKQDKDTVLGFIAHIPENPAQDRQREAVNTILHAEAFFISLRDQVAKKVKDLSDECVQDPTDQTKKDSLRRYNRFLERLQETNRYALWATAAFPNPEICYQRVLHDLYETAYANVKEPAEKPSFAEFCASAESLPLRKYAAEVASTLITDPKEYREFCLDEKNIEPKLEHINRFLLHALQNPPNSVDLSSPSLGSIRWTLPEKTEIQTMLGNAPIKTNVTTSIGNIKDIAQMSPAKRLKAAVEDTKTGIGNLVRDTTIPKPNIFQRIQNAVTKRF